MFAVVHDRVVPDVTVVPGQSTEFLIKLRENLLDIVLLVEDRQALYPHVVLVRNTSTVTSAANVGRTSVSVSDTANVRHLWSQNAMKNAEENSKMVDRLCDYFLTGDSNYICKHVIPNKYCRFNEAIHKWID